MKRSTGCWRIASSKICVPSTFVVTNSRRACLDRLLDVRLGSCVDDHVHLRDDLAHELGIADVAVDERMPLVRADRREVVHAARIGQRIERDDLAGRRLEDVADEVRRDESRAAGDQNSLRSWHAPKPS